jgi:GH15 family glucan-1,4-alpha-glucosidase
LWHYFARSRDVETIKPLYRPLAIRAANWLCDYRDPRTGLPRPSYDLWEERFGIHAWTLGTVFGGLQAAANLAEAFGETDLAGKYRGVAADLRLQTDRHLWRDSVGRFVRTLYRKDAGELEPDVTIDASLAGLYRFGMYAPDDPRIVATMQAIHDRLWLKTGTIRSVRMWRMFPETLGSSAPPGSRSGISPWRRMAISFSPRGSCWTGSPPARSPAVSWRNRSTLTMMRR